MAICARCGANASEEASFCSSCGAALKSNTQAGAGSAALESNVAALLAYVLGFITGIIFLMLEPYKRDQFVRFHALQSILFSVAITVFWIAWSILSAALGVVTLGAMTVVMAGLGLLVGFAITLYWIYLMYKAYRMEWYMIPYIGPLAASRAR